jgi:hypothetical protein
MTQSRHCAASRGHWIFEDIQPGKERNCGRGCELGTHAGKADRITAQEIAAEAAIDRASLSALMETEAVLTNEVGLLLLRKLREKVIAA